MGARYSKIFSWEGCDDRQTSVSRCRKHDQRARADQKVIQCPKTRAADQIFRVAGVHLDTPDNQCDYIICSHSGQREMRRSSERPHALRHFCTLPLDRSELQRQTRSDGTCHSSMRRVIRASLIGILSSELLGAPRSRIHSLSVHRVRISDATRGPGSQEISPWTALALVHSIRFGGSANPSRPVA